MSGWFNLILETECDDRRAKDNGRGLKDRGQCPGADVSDQDVEEGVGGCKTAGHKGWRNQK
jgi:hypothetical protein